MKIKRGKFILTALSIFPLTVLAKIKSNLIMRTDKGFKVKAGEARFGEHFKMKDGSIFKVLDKWTSPPGKRRNRKSLC